MRLARALAAYTFRTMTETRHGSPAESPDAGDRFVQLADERNDGFPRNGARVARTDATGRDNVFASVTREDKSGQTLDPAAACDWPEYDKMLRDDLDEIGSARREVTRGQPQPS